MLTLMGSNFLCRCYACLLLLPLHCINFGICLYCMVIQNLVTRCKNAHLITVNSIKILSLCHIQQFSGIIQLLEGPQPNSSKMPLIEKESIYASLWHNSCLLWILSSHWTLLQLTSSSKVQAQLVYRYECSYVIRWLKTENVTRISISL